MLPDKLCSIRNAAGDVQITVTRAPSVRSATPKLHHLKIFAHSSSDVVPFSVQRTVIENYVLDRSTEDFDFFSNKCKYFDELKPLFIKYNTPLPLPAPVERIFSVAKDYYKLNEQI